MRTLSYKTEQQVRSEAYEELRVKRLSTNGGEYDERKIREEFSQPTYQRWVNDTVLETYRRQGLLLTEVQLRDLKAHRAVQEGDRLRYIGPSRLEPSQRTGKLIPRPTGQVGEVVSVQQSQGRRYFTFRQHIDRQTREAADAGLDVEVLDLLTDNWKEFERIER